MKYLLLLVLNSCAFLLNAQSHLLVKSWETDTTVAVPESVLFHKDKLFVSLIDGAPWEDDGKGVLPQCTLMAAGITAHGSPALAHQKVWALRVTCCM